MQNSPASAALHKNLIALSFLAVIISIVFSPSLRNGFVNWDDDVHLLENPYIRSLDSEHIKKIFTTTVNTIYIPLTSLSFAVERHYFGLNPFVYHFNNLLLHVGTCMLVFVFARQCGLALFAAFLAALTFGIHPMHVESVAWVTERKDVLSGFFYVLALSMYLQYLQALKRGAMSPQVGFYCLSIAAVLLSVLAKPMAASLVLIFCLLDWFMKRPRSLGALRDKIPFVLFLVPVVVVTSIFQVRNLNIWNPENVLVWMWSIVFYVKQFFLPSFFVLFYKIPQPINFENPIYSLALASIVLILASLWVFRRDRLYLFAWAFYAIFICLLWRWAAYRLVADRFMYLPSIGFCLWLGFIVERFLSSLRPFGKVLLIGTLMCVLVLFSYKSLHQCYIWKDSVSLWSHQLAYEPDAVPALVYYKLGEGYMREEGFEAALLAYGQGDMAAKKQVDRVRDYYYKAISVRQSFSNPYHQLGLIAHRLGDLRKAKKYFLRAVYYKPKHFEAYFELGTVNQDLGLHEEAIAAFQKAVNITPEDPDFIQKVIKRCNLSLPDNAATRLYLNEVARLMSL